MTMQCFGITKYNLSMCLFDQELRFFIEGLGNQPYAKKNILDAQ